MNNFPKIIDKLHLCLIITFLIGSINILNILAAVTDEDVKIINQIEGSHKPLLRGEIWYGTASWYGNRFNGRRTASGEKLNPRKLTAAHRYLPFNTKVKVTNLKNNKTVIVRITDRGPFHGNRIVDLSEKAAEKLDSKATGLAYVKVQVVNPLIDFHSDREIEDN